MLRKERTIKFHGDDSYKLHRPILQEVEIIYNGPLYPEPIQVKNSRDVYECLEKVYDKRKMDYKEMFYVLLLNHANYCIGVSQIGVGTTSGVAVNFKEVFQLALKTNASGIILSHNHPSGNLRASDADISITKKLKAAADYLEVKLLDDIIITSGGYLSLADEGLF